MPPQRSSGHSDGAFAPSFQDRSFQSRSPFDVEEEMRRLDHNMTSLDDFSPDHMDFDLDGMYTDDMEPNFFGNQGEQFQMSSKMSSAQGHGISEMDQAQMPHISSRQHAPLNQNNKLSAPPSIQSDIVHSRGNQVNEVFGQITPPDESTSGTLMDPSPTDQSETRKSQEEDIAKMNRTQRARNAANKRHSKSKAARRDSLQGDASDRAEGSKEQKSTNLQREKNRVAAAKCRAKKKANSEEMQESHRDESRQNSYLLREMRELRDQKAFLRNSLLQHEPGLCQCHAIHRFNMVQAHQLAFGVGMMLDQPMSPSQESVGSVPTPSSDASIERLKAAAGSVEAPGRTEVPSNGQSFASSANYSANQITDPDPTFSAPASGPDLSQAPQQFADFLHSSTDGRSGFSWKN